MLNAPGAKRNDYAHTHRHPDAEARWCSNPNQYGFNIGCLEGVNPYDLGDVEVTDGVNHPADR